jgi:hypothetical protein
MVHQGALVHQVGEGAPRRVDTHGQCVCHFPRRTPAARRQSAEVLENGQLLTFGSSLAGESLGRILVSCVEVLEGGPTFDVP